MIKTEEVKPRKGKKGKAKGREGEERTEVRGGQVEEKVFYKRDFMDEILGKIVVMRLEDEADPVVGKVLEHSPYWLKIVDANGKLMYVNKAYIKILLPAKEG
jgi:hypothetical protein